MRTMVLSTALLGGVAWVTNLFVGSDALSVVGTVLLGLAVLVVGSRLAREVWVAVVTAVGSVALSWSLLELLRRAYDGRVLEAVLGGAAGLAVAIAVARLPSEPASHGVTSRRGNHRG